MLNLLELLTELSRTKPNVFLEEWDSLEYLIEPDIVIRLWEVDCQSQWNDRIDIKASLLTIGLHIEEQLVFSCQRLMVLDVINQLFVAKFA